MIRARSHEVVRTKGGALALRDVATGEVMHPGVGPRAEAEALYVRQSGLAERLAEAAGAASAARVVVFDVGLGAGSNAVAAWAASERAPAAAARLELVSFERDLDALALALEHGSAFAFEGASATAARALLAHGRHETARTNWRLVRGDIVDALDRETARADIVFWDPFSPRVNPELWTIAAFRAARARAADAGTLFTYSASTAVRLALLLAGWTVGVGDAVGDKRATTAAAVRAGDLARPLDRPWLARLERPDVPLPPDLPPETRRDLARVAGALPQFAVAPPPAATRSERS
ncbi:MAG: MnmC family methyltransferase [Pseudomonadota bacterium]